MQAIHQKFYMNKEFPLSVYVTETQEFPPHWHEAVEIICALEEPIRIGMSQTMITLAPGDILLVSSGEVHSFPMETKPIPRLISQFDLSFLESFSPMMRDKCFALCHLQEDGEYGKTHRAMTSQLHAMLKEAVEKQLGYKMAMRARLYDILLLMLRDIPMETLSATEKSKRLERLDRLDRVLQYVESHYDQTILLEDVAALANFSIFHFTRFFRETTGLTFCQYVNQFRIAKSVDYLLNTNDSITELTYKSGFNNAKTFNRVFRQFKGCSPTDYKAAVFSEGYANI